jgi:hypothetical protein
MSIYTKSVRALMKESMAPALAPSKAPYSRSSKHLTGSRTTTQRSSQGPFRRTWRGFQQMFQGVFIFPLNQAMTTCSTRLIADIFAYTNRTWTRRQFLQRNLLGKMRKAIAIGNWTRMMEVSDRQSSRTKPTFAIT